MKKPEPMLPSEDVDAQTVARLTAVEAPTFYAAAAQASIVGNDFVLSFARWRMLMDPKSLAPTAIAAQQPVCIVEMSTKTAKDICLLLTDAVQKYEKDWGEIETDYSRRLKAADAHPEKAVKKKK